MWFRLAALSQGFFPKAFVMINYPSTMSGDYSQREQFDVRARFLVDLFTLLF